MGVQFDQCDDPVTSNNSAHVTTTTSSMSISAGVTSVTSTGPNLFDMLKQSQAKASEIHKNVKFNKL